MQVVYEDNHIIHSSKRSEIVQGDKTGDEPLEIGKQRHQGEVSQAGKCIFGVVHRLTGPVSGLVVFAKTS